MYVCITSMVGQRTENGIGFLSVELWMVVNHHMVARTKPRSLGKNSKCLTEQTLQTHQFSFLNNEASSWYLSFVVYVNCVITSHSALPSWQETAKAMCLAGLQLNFIYISEWQVSCVHSSSSSSCGGNHALSFSVSVAPGFVLGAKRQCQVQD